MYAEGKPPAEPLSQSRQQRRQLVIIAHTADQQGGGEGAALRGVGHDHAVARLAPPACRRPRRRTRCCAGANMAEQIGANTLRVAPSPSAFFPTSLLDLFSSLNNVRTCPIL